MEAWRPNMHTDFLDRLRGTGVEPDEIEFVVNTHLHFDHVGGTPGWSMGPGVLRSPPPIT
jgi:glyoxylase-like metal-dependent hydrolase (beta-lactamase superfamily II)